MSDAFERIGSELVWQGRIAGVRVDRFRHADGEEVTREIVTHPGAVTVVACDGERVWLVRQPREAAGEQTLLELPAGKLDVDGEPPLATARRELAEETGKLAAHWEELASFYASPGFSDERIHVFLATGLSEAPQRPAAEEDERIELVPWPLAELDELIAECRDGKSLVGLLLLARRLDAAG